MNVTGCGGARRAAPAGQRRRAPIRRAARSRAAASQTAGDTVVERRACDVLVIGDGITGALAAYSAAKAGRKARRAAARSALQCPLMGRPGGGAP